MAAVHHAQVTDLREFTGRQKDPIKGLFFDQADDAADRKARLEDMLVR